MALKPGFDQAPVVGMDPVHPAAEAFCGVLITEFRKQFPVFRIEHPVRGHVPVPYAVAAAFKSEAPSFLAFMKGLLEFFMFGYVGMYSYKRHYCARFIFKRRDYDVSRKRRLVFSGAHRFKFHVTRGLKLLE